MGIPVEKRRYSVQEYLELEEASETRNEFHGGEILAMAGTTFEHSAIFINLATLLRQGLRGSPCRPLDGNLRVKVPRIPRYVYPDLSIVCGKPQFDPDDQKKKTIINPKVIIEILSKKTESYDRGDKFSFYRDVASLEEYVLVSQRQATVETYLRQADGSWSFRAYHGLDADVNLRSLPIVIPAREIYADVEFDSAEDVGPA
jgi:Uma2 family endonuclease